jgi:hypothetical protein
LRTLLGSLLLLAFCSPALAQPTSTQLRREVARASFLVGEWEGEGWVKYAPDGERREARVAAEGRPTLAGVALAWKSVARAADGGVVSDDDFTLRFRRDSAAFRVSVHVPGHPVADGWARVAECELSWGFQMPAAGAGDHFRFTVRVDAENRLTEVGERSPDGGRTWWQYYGAEMKGRSDAGCRAPAT